MSTKTMMSESIQLLQDDLVNSQCDYCRAPAQKNIGLVTARFNACSKECAVALMREDKRLSS